MTAASETGDKPSRPPRTELSFEDCALVEERYRLDGNLTLIIRKVTEYDRVQGRFLINAANADTMLALPLVLESLGLRFSVTKFGQVAFDADKLSQLVSVHLAGSFNFYMELLLPGETSMLRSLYEEVLSAGAWGVLPCGAWMR